MLRELPLLSLTLWLPLLGALLLWALPAHRVRAAAVVAQLATLAASLAVLLAFVPDEAGFQLCETHPWLPGLGIAYRLGVDGLSVLFLPSTALLGLGVLAVCWPTGAAPRTGLSALLGLQSCLLGLFSSLDLGLFFLYWELSVLPIYLLTSRWGVTPSAPAHAARYALIMLASGIPLLLAFLLIAQAGGSFALPDLLATRLPYAQQLGFFLLCLLAFGVKIPLVPLHTWLPALAIAAPGGLTALLLGLKIGAYALLRLAIPLAPDAAQSLHWLLAGLGTVSLIYGGVAMLGHSNLRAVLACASISHVGLVVLGLSAFTAQGTHGAISLLLSFSLASGGALILLEALRQRTGSTDLIALGGVASRMPLLSAGLFLCGMAGLGLPGTSSFPGEFLLLLAILETHTGAGMAALFGLAIAASAFLAAYRKACFGEADRPAVRQAHDLERHERLVLYGLIALILGIGLHPGPWLDIPRAAAEAWALALRH